MKRLTLILMLVTAFAQKASAQWAVIDVANLQESILTYAAMGEQIAKQATQISNQIQQIKQFQSQLDRMGDMANFKNLAGFSQFRADLKLPTKTLLWADGVAKVDGKGFFEDTRGGIYQGVSKTFPGFDGVQIERDPQIFKDNQNVTVSVDEFKMVQNDVYSRRENLKKAIATTSDAMQAATTEAEQQKLQAVLNAQYGQLAAVESEVTLSAAEVQVKEAEANAMNDAQEKATAETHRVLAQQEAVKISETFKPRYECMLKYVTEQNLSP